jgi:ATP-dependent HslUV protease subunit HslV
VDIDGLSAEEICHKSMKIASEICIYTNSNFTIEALETDAGSGSHSTSG